MAKSNWLNEINEAIDSLETETARVNFPKTRYHRLFLRKDDIVKGFKQAAEMRAKKKSVTIPSKYNTDKVWSEAFAAAWSHERKDFRQKPQLKTLNDLKQLGDNKGLYIETDNANLKVILAVPMNDAGKGAASAIRTKTVGGNSKDGFDTRFRKRVWREWLDATGLQTVIGNYNADVGSELPSAHKNTLGQGVVLEYFRELFEGINQSENEDSFFGQFVSSTETEDVRKRIMSAISIDWNQEEVPNFEDGILKMKRVIDVEVIEVARNKGNKDDLQYLKTEIKQVIKDRLATIKPMQGADAILFESSKNFKDKQKDLGIYTLTDKVAKTLKKSKSVKPKKTKKDAKPKAKTNTGGSARKAKKYIAHKQGGLNINKVVTPRKLATGKRRAVDEVLKLTNKINKRLGAEVRRNMGRPALINRTGDFSNSAKLLELHPTAKGLSGSFTYTLTGGGRSKNRQGVYQTFENGRWPAGYNPKPLIAKSIRKLAEQYTEQKVTSLRRR